MFEWKRYLSKRKMYFLRLFSFDMVFQPPSAGHPVSYVFRDPLGGGAPLSSDFVSHFLAGRAPSVGKPTSSPLSGKSTPLQRGNPPSRVGLRGRLRMTKQAGQRAGSGRQDKRGKGQAQDDRTHIISFCHSDPICLTGLGRISKRYGLSKISNAKPA